MPEERSRVLMPARRVGSSQEVVLGLKPREVVENARIYLERERALKGQPCPLGTDHIEVLRLAARSQMAPALELLLKTNPLPEATGRLCPEIFEETICQNHKGARVSLRAIERFLADTVTNIRVHAIVAHLDSLPLVGRVREGGAKVAIIGSGPAGLSAAWMLMRKGYQVSVFDAAPVVGGTLSYGQAECEFPRKAMDAIIRRFEAAGIVFKTDHVFGRMAVPAELLEEGYGAVLLATGAGVIEHLGIPDENAGGVIAVDDLLKAVNWRGEDPRLWLGEKVVIVGASDQGFSAARVALRAKQDVTIVVSGPETSIKADPMFVRHAFEEGLKVKAFTKAVKILTDEAGCATGLACRYLDYRMDAKGCMVLVEDAASDFTLPATTVINASAWQADTLFLRDIPGLLFNADGSLQTKPELAETAVPGVFAAGGAVEAAMSLTDAMLSGIRAAGEIHKYLE